MQHPQILTRADMASSMCISKSAVDRLAAEGKLKKIQITKKRVGFLSTELDRYLTQQTCQLTS